jgi:hypothetical protein
MELNSEFNLKENSKYNENQEIISEKESSNTADKYDNLKLKSEKEK